jgi:NAD(P)-dependent dehydrogenase (short-subunit alcohol dehydrogenase family)
MHVRQFILGYAPDAQKGELPMRLADRVALVTGGGSGIGRAACLALAQEGARIGVLGLTEESVNRVAEEIDRAGGWALPLTADISQPEQIQSAIETLARRWSRLDIIFANAGINGVWAPLEDLTPQDWDQTLNINLKGTFLTIKYAAPYLKRQGGSIIITSSVNGTRVFSNIGATAYSCSKAGQVALAKMLALELARDGIRVNVICPGSIETPIDEKTERRGLEDLPKQAEFPQGKVPLTGGQPGRPEQVADLVVFLASDAAGHISGTEIWIDGAESLLVG